MNEKRIITIIILVTFICVTSSIFAADIEKEEKIREGQKIIRDLEELERKSIPFLKDLVEDTTFSCIASFGHRPFCACLAENLPISMSFNEYVYLTSTPKSELLKLDIPEDKRWRIDKVRTIRDKCVSEYVK